MGFADTFRCVALLTVPQTNAPRRNGKDTSTGPYVAPAGIWNSILVSVHKLGVAVTVESSVGPTNRTPPPSDPNPVPVRTALLPAHPPSGGRPSIEYS